MSLLDALATRHQGTLVTPRGSIGTHEILERAAAAISVALPGARSWAAPRLVWIAAERPEVAVGALAVLSASHCCVLVESRMKDAEYDALAVAAMPDLVVADEHSSAAVGWATARKLPASVIASPETGTAVAVAAPATRELDPGIGFFTSGTTGVPKAVLHSSGSILAAADGVARILGLRAEDVSLSMVPLHRTLGLVTTVLCGLLSGGAVLAVPVLDTASLRSLLLRHCPTWSAGSPPVLSSLGWLTAERAIELPGLRLLRSSAAPLRPAVQSRLSGIFDIPVINAYAMTEAAGEISSQRLPPDSSAIGSVGRPSLCEVAVRPAPCHDGAGGLGEIWIRGSNVAAGPYARDDPEGWFCTRDLGMLTDRGDLVLLGRRDEIMNRGGELISPHEIESVAEEHLGVAQAVAFPIPDRRLGERVGLAVVPSGAGLEQADVRRFLMDRLSLSKLPGTIVIVDSIPSTSHGKVARRRLHARLRIKGALPIDEAAARETG
jgi:acyl-CoA synthetase (AMP-forming)/AMP-acid ligase II